MFKYIAAVALFIAPAIAGPWTNATCVRHFWSVNSQGQNPCLVTAYLGALCILDNTWGVSAMNASSGGSYGFDPDYANLCMCNSVVWNLISACALCQNGTTGSWGQWIRTCPKDYINIGKYPIPLPSGVAVPSWAYYDFTIAGTFNASVASRQTGLESSAISGATSTSIATKTSDSTPTTEPVLNLSRSSSNTGAIIGGVVGGILGIGLFALVAFILVWKRKPEGPMAMYPETSYKPPLATEFNQATPMAARVSGHQFGAPNQPTVTSEYKPYDPSNLSTLPTGPATPTTGHYPEPLPYSYQPRGISGHVSYPSAPQV